MSISIINDDPKCNKKVLSKILDISEKTLSDWQKEGLPIHIVGGRGKENMYDVPKVIEWMFNKKLMSAATANLNSDGEEGSQDAKELMAERILKTREERIEKQLKNQERRKELIQVSIVENEWLDIIGDIDSLLSTLASRLSKYLYGLEDRQEIKDTINEQVDLIRKALAQNPVYDSTVIIDDEEDDDE